MPDSPRLMPISTINAAYGGGPYTVGLVNCTVGVNINVGANVNVGANAAAVINAVAAANAIAVSLVVVHHTPIGQDDPRIAAEAERVLHERAENGEEPAPVIGR